MEKKKRHVPDDSRRSAELGDETGDWSSPRPEENVVDEIGAEAGAELEEGEPLRPLDKVARRDQRRAELEPDSDEAYPERMRDRRVEDDEDAL